MTCKSSLLFNIRCTSCYGTEFWRFERIVHALSLIPEAEIPAYLPPDFDVEVVAAQFIAFSKEVVCPGCGKKGTLKIWRIKTA